MDANNRKHLISYTGSEPYALTVFSPQDETITVPLCLKLQRAGYRLQFAAPETDQIQSASLCLFMVSAHFLESHNLRQLLNMAFLSKKSIILLLLDRFEMMTSFKIQIKSSQTLRYWEYDNEEVLLSVLQANPLLEPCRQSNKTVYYPKDQHYCRFSLIRRKTGEKITINHSGFKIGRQKDACDYAIEDNATVSRIHAIFELDLGFCTIRDNASTNRVYLNNLPLLPDEEKVLKQDDLIELGSEKFHVVIEDLSDD